MKGIPYSVIPFRRSCIGRKPVGDVGTKRVVSGLTRGVCSWISQRSVSVCVHAFMCTLDQFLRASPAQFEDLNVAGQPA